MDAQPSDLLQTQRDGSIVTLTLNRPERHNAFDDHLIAVLTHQFRTLAEDETLRAIVLRGAGPSFSAGGDLGWMQASLNLSYEENRADASALADLFATINAVPCVVIAGIQGAAMGGGLGLVSVCDIAIATASARFAFSEVRIGLAPATIAPFVLAKIGPSHARALFTTGERFTAEHALHIGLIHRIVADDQLDQALLETVNHVRASGPQAIRAAKRLARDLWRPNDQQVRELTIETIATLRTGEEGQEGLRAFLEKRRARWVEGAR